jgi:hypothetical protein
MAENEERSASIPWLPLITLVAVSSGVLLFFQQLTSSRPGGGDPRLTDNTFEGQSIDARLWQDPLGVTAEDREKRGSAEGHSVADFRELMARKCFPALPIGPLARRAIYPLEEKLRFVEQSDRILVLAVMIPGGPYVEDVERRLRSRRAVVEGLGTAGYDPEKDHEIGYFLVPWLPLQPDVTGCVSKLQRRRDEDEGLVQTFPARSKPERVIFKHPTRADRTDERVADSLLVPYEWCDQTTLGENKRPLQRILILWLQDDAFSDAPLARLADFLSWFRFKLVTASGDGDFLPLPGVTVLGPDNSGTLQGMVKEANENPWDSETRACLEKVHIYSSQASAAESQLLPETHFVSSASPFDWTCKRLIEENVRSGDLGSRFHFDRTNLTDDQIATTLWQELQRRGVGHAGDHVVILSEQDTFFARALSTVFIQLRPKLVIPHASPSPIDTRWYTYLRGIDGKLPQDEKDDGEPRGENEGNARITKGSLRPTEQTEGVNQADDIRRLANELRRLDQTWRGEGGCLKAVGLLGSDVYDKLELLKALRPILPDAVFFTNHLDARMAHPDESKEAHNLVVVSSLGLTMNRSWDASHGGRYQNVAPFRDSGQTGLYEATLEAVGMLQTRSPANSPRIVEIGRDGYRELSLSGDENTVMELFRLIRFYVIPIIGLLVSACVLLLWVHAVSRVPLKTLEEENPPS